jgi:hypothetical protein
MTRGRFAWRSCWCLAVAVVLVDLALLLGPT